MIKLYNYLFNLNKSSNKIKKMDAQRNVLKSKFTPYAPNHEHAYLNPLYPQNIELEFYKKTEVEALLRSKKDYKKNFY